MKKIVTKHMAPSMDKREYLDKLKKYNDKNCLKPIPEYSLGLIRLKDEYIERLHAHIAEMEENLHNAVNVAINCRLSLECTSKHIILPRKYPDEKPPESGVLYLAWVDGVIPVLAIYGHHLLCEDGSCNKWYSDEGPAKDPIPYGEGEITHWTSIPLPIEKADEDLR